ncbi:hypothetical protein NL676_029891 [Syzygium grande]|nr:hypothetical protein NL676_029891 [Syzygium grande]
MVVCSIVCKLTLRNFDQSKTGKDIHTEAPNLLVGTIGIAVQIGLHAGAAVLLQVSKSCRVLSSRHTISCICILHGICTLVHNAHEEEKGGSAYVSTFG